MQNGPITAVRMTGTLHTQHYVHKIYQSKVGCIHKYTYRHWDMST